MARSREEALELAARVLAQRDRSQSALVGRLMRAGVEAELAERVVGDLVAAGYVDDERLARERAESLATRGYGNAGIAARLEADGVSSAAIDAAIRQLQPEEERGRELAARDGGGSRRLSAALRRRGFGEDTIEAVLGSLDGQDRPSLR